ncbi:hypothetical protein FEM48_Zijuj01G0037200 [Ziziphus jujuba var. spinosa]|uniref:Uncharacterized protein n=1 Tax=Ziziphus jujuba var. spinosa TaxID=714518 RepID=A0A978VYY7_ZIZJJ|nr:hypothetical protein FEM48_Zijuj01G0037200 [Ziziphus jujuba var. spinosa]
MELVDPKLVNVFDKEEAVRMLEVALLCLSPSLTLRLIMSAELVNMLEASTWISIHQIIISLYSLDKQ